MRIRNTAGAHLRPVLVLAAVTVATAAATARAEAPVLKETCLTPADHATVVSFRTGDGARILGASFGEGDTGVVLAHQYGSDVCEWRDFARLLVGRGYRVLAVDLRGWGSSPAVGGDRAYRMDRDVTAAAAELRREGASRVVAVGASMGATAALVAAATPGSRIDGAVSLSAPAAYYGLDAKTAMKRLRVPVRFVAARGDRNFAEDARTLFRAAASKDKALLVVGGGVHGSSLLYTSFGGARVRSTVLTLLARVANPRG